VPIASITKLMTAMVVLDSMPNLQAPITISDEDIDYLRGSRSRLGVGTVITRETALLLALMSSENRASNALGRHYPGGLAGLRRSDEPQGRVAGDELIRASRIQPGSAATMYPPHTIWHGWSLLRIAIP
jgi:hypothetical protein